MNTKFILSLIRNTKCVERGEGWVGKEGDEGGEDPDILELWDFAVLCYHGN